MEEQIKSMMEEYQKALRLLNSITEEHDTAVEKAMEVIKEELDKIEAYYKPTMLDLLKSLNEFEPKIKELVVAHGSTVNIPGIKAIYNKGRVSWDTKGLDGFMVAHPEITAFRSIGKPSVSIRIEED